MTSIDLRIRYKSETGFAPTYGKYGEDDQLQLFPFISVQSCNYQGGIMRDYAIWLEGKFWKYKREKYYKTFGAHPVYKDKKGETQFTRNYKEWLEEERCKFQN